MATGTIKKSNSEWSLLWENPSPTAAFAETDVTISDIDQYSEFLIYFRYNTSATYYQTYNAINLGVGTEAYGIAMHTYLSRRLFTQTASGFLFAVAQRQTAYNSWTNVNDYCIPTHIYGK